MCSVYIISFKRQHFLKCSLESLERLNNFPKILLFANGRGSIGTHFSVMSQH